ncbi:MAG: aromatic hydrocarbon degradation protein [Alcanivoracaceae bacterium]|nr:aromatic hydrocarbon degradation protein [Alcanivoracaceae bacterium]
MISRHVRDWRFACALMVLSSSASANMGNLATTYGVLPTDVASAQALSLFNSQVSATYYNPSYLTKDTRGELTTGLLHGDQSLKAKSVSSNGFQVRNGDTLSNEPTQHVLIGMKTNLTSLTKYERPIYLGFMAGVEKYGKEMMAFSSGTSATGQYLTYGREPLFLNLGGAMEVIDGLSVGASARITLHAEADMKTYSNLAGDTQYEELNVSAKPSIRPILGVTADVGKLLCQEECFFSGWEAALSYRGYSNTQTSVNAQAIIPGTISPPGLLLSINTLDSYQPDILALGVQYKANRWRAGVTLEHQGWSALEDELKKDTIKDQANLKFDDILIPRLGAEFEPIDNIFITTGVAFIESPLKSTSSEDVSYLDTDKTVFGLGVAMELTDPPVLAFPVRLEFGYQMQQLKDRDFDLVTSFPGNPSNPYETVTASGEVHVFTGSLTLKF